MNQPLYTVHVAGPMVDDVQNCARCGIILIDRKNLVEMIPASRPRRPSFWPDGSFVLSGPHGGAVLMERDAKEADEIPCGAIQ